VRKSTKLCEVWGRCKDNILVKQFSHRQVVAVSPWSEGGPLHHCKMLHVFMPQNNMLLEVYQKTANMQKMIKKY
jgi:hypothetical protein